MFKKNYLSLSFLFAILLITAGLLLQVRPVQASAEPVAGSGDSSCLTCHEDRYYQHDTGNYYCLTEAASRCVDCHAGNPDAADEKTAHAGLIIHPILNGDISRCETCHGADAQAHVDIFAARAGFSESVLVAATAPAPASSQTAPVEPSQITLDQETITALSVVATLIAGLFFFCIMTNRSCH